MQIYNGWDMSSAEDGYYMEPTKVKCKGSEIHFICRPNCIVNIHLKAASHVKHMSLFQKE